MTRLLRSLIVAARWLAPLSFKGFRHSARLGRISPPGWSLLPGAPALTRTGLAPARTSRLSGRTIGLDFNMLKSGFSPYENRHWRGSRWLFPQGKTAAETGAGRPRSGRFRHRIGRVLRLSGLRANGGAAMSRRAAATAASWSAPPASAWPSRPTKSRACAPRPRRAMMKSSSPASTTTPTCSPSAPSTWTKTARSS